MKQRFSSLDVLCISTELAQTLPSLRLTQVYDLSSRIFLIKFGRPGHRASLIVDAGFRAHLTNFTRTAASAPSAFVTKLRKYLKSRRVTGVRQVGRDRVIEIEFSEGTYRLYLEFFAAGNLVLCDREGTVLVVWRNVSEGDEEVDIRVGAKYNVVGKQGVKDVTIDALKDVLQRAVEKLKALELVGGKKGKRRKDGEDLKKVVAVGFPAFSVQLIEHAFKKGGVDEARKPEEVLNSKEALERVLKAVEIAQQVSNSIIQGRDLKGYIIATRKERSDAPSPAPKSEIAGNPTPSRDSLLYDDFHPFRPVQFEDQPGVHVLEFDGFNKTVDEFYSSIESQKLEFRLTEREEKAKQKIEAAKSEHEKRVGALQQVQEMHIRKAQTIEANTHRVEEAIAAVNGLIGQGMDWMDIAKLIEVEQGRGNAVAEMVKLPLKLYENTVTLLLDEPGQEFEDSGYEDSDFDDMTDESASESEEEDHKAAAQAKSKPLEKRLAIDIDLGQTPWANARQYYDQKKTAAVKEQKTVQSSAMALESQQRKIEADLKKGLKEEKQVLRQARKSFWFEKFVYFLSSDGYLVLGGKDAQQNELLYRRYLKKGDIYVHADLQGAASVVVKNLLTTPDAPIPPSTLNQAGALSVCTSSAWDSKAVMAAWWVNADQVSKTAPSGEYLTTGGFMIRGKKNFLPPSQLLLGFGVLFLVSEASRKNHGKGRYGDVIGLDKTESIIVEEEGKKLDGEMQDLKIEDQDDDIDDIDDIDDEDKKDLVPDMEDAAEEARAEIDQDEHVDALSDDESEDDDKDSVAGSDVESKRLNPLQMRDRAGKNETEIENEHNKENDTDEKDDHEQDDEHEISDSEKEQGSHSASRLSKSSQTPSTGRGTPTPSNATSNKLAPLPRGKRRKAKKAAKRYAEQDDEDRALAMALLGSNKAQERKQAEIDSKTAREAKAALDKERRRAQHEKAAERERIREEKLKAGEIDPAEEDVGEEQAEQERRELAQLALLVGQPLPGDEIVAAIPVVGPWGALGKCKYKVKIQPGAMKKGKAVKEIVGKWGELGKAGPRILDAEQKDKDRVWPREVEMIKNWRVEEIVGVVPVGKLRVVWSGGLGGSGGSGGGGGGGGGVGKGKVGARGGKGSKKGR